MFSYLRRWLLSDQIRIAPDEGRLLCLRIGQRVILDNELFVVTVRNEITDSELPTVRYCLTAHDDAITCLPDSPVHIDAMFRDMVKIERSSDIESVWMECSQ